LLISEMNRQEPDNLFAIAGIFGGATLQVAHLKVQVENMRHIKRGDMSPHSKANCASRNLQQRMGQQSAIKNHQSEIRP